MKATENNLNAWGFREPPWASLPVTELRPVIKKAPKSPIGVPGTSAMLRFTSKCAMKQR